MSKTPKKFALIGTSCVGKTTLLLELKKVLQKKYKNKNIITVPEAARYYFEKRKVRKPFSYINQYNIQSLAKEFEKKAEMQKPDIIICDRSVLDAVAYTHAAGKKQNTKKIFNRIDDWLKTYQHLFLLDPNDIDYKIDSIRKEHKKTREKFHQSFLEILSNSSLPWTLISGTIYERIPKIMNIIEATQ